MTTPRSKLGNSTQFLSHSAHDCLSSALDLRHGCPGPGTDFGPQRRTADPDERPGVDALYRQGTSVGMPPGRVRGTALLAPGTRRNAALARGTRLVWQGKVFEPAEAFAVNRFFGLPMIRAQVFQDQSWLDGAPALVLDYSRTSRVYAQYRDEIRQIAPGLFLGLMYARTTPQPTLRMYFALESQP